MRTIIVLAAVRLGCNFDYDKLQDLAEQHRTLRLMMGIGDWQDDADFDWRRIRDNLCLLQPQTLEQINRALGRRGKVWEEESFDRALRREESIGDKVDYILGNPVGAGLAANPLEYRWLWRDTGGNDLPEEQRAEFGD